MVDSLALPARFVSGLPAFAVTVRKNKNMQMIRLDENV